MFQNRASVSVVYLITMNTTLYAPDIVFDPLLAAWIDAMPKAEIHIHLEGSIQPETLLTLAARHNRTASLPTTDLDGLRRWFTFTDFPHFVRIYMLISDLLRTPEDFALIVEACGADMAAQNIRYHQN